MTHPLSIVSRVFAGASFSWHAAFLPSHVGYTCFVGFRPCSDHWARRTTFERTPNSKTIVTKSTPRNSSVTSRWGIPWQTEYVKALSTRLKRIKSGVQNFPSAQTKGSASMGCGRHRKLTFALGPFGMHPIVPQTEKSTKIHYGNPQKLLS